MKVLGPSSNQEMVLAFLQGELDSPRFGADVRAALERRGLDEGLIRVPNLGDNIENAHRAATLLEYRPWLGDPDALREWPPNATWEWVDLTRTDVEDLRYITFDYWDALSRGTHLVREGARSIRNGTVIFEVPNDRFWDVARKINAGEPLLPLIIFSSPSDGNCTLIEGHLRATSYLLAQHAPATMRALHGEAGPVTAPRAPRP